MPDYVRDHHACLCLIMISISCRSLPRGLQAPPEKSIAVTFHAIVPLPFWEGEDSNSHMHIRFDWFALGQWRYDCGVMMKQRLVPYLRCAKDFVLTKPPFPL